MKWSFCIAKKCWSIILVNSWLSKMAATFLALMNLLFLTFVFYNSPLFHHKFATEDDPHLPVYTFSSVLVQVNLNQASLLAVGTCADHWIASIVTLNSTIVTNYDSTAKSLCLILLHLIILSGDISLNPGPNWLYPCGICKNPVQQIQKDCNATLVILGITHNPVWLEIKWHQFGEHFLLVDLLWMQHFILIKRNFWFCEQETKSTLYKELVRPKMEYASVMWDPYYRCDIDNVENIQRTAAGFCKNNYKYMSNVTVMIKDLEWESFASRRKKSLVVHHVQDYTQYYPHAQT